MTIDGGDGNDSIENHTGDSVSIAGGDGNDTIYNNSMDTTINGGAGNDIILVEEGYNHSADSVIIGGTGNDIISLGSGTNYHSIIYTLGDGNDTIYGFYSLNEYGANYHYLTIVDGTYTTVASGNDIIVKVGSGSILLKDASALDSNRIKTVNSSSIGIGIRDNVLRTSTSFLGKSINLADYNVTKATAAALSRAVSIIGTSADNSIKGGKGADTISGGAGNDTLTGGNGADVFVYSSGNDLITDYVAGQDKIKLTSGSITGSSLSGSNVVLKTSGGSITVRNGKDKNITVIDSSGKETTQTYPATSNDTIPVGISIKSATLTASASFTGNKIDLADYASTVTKVNASALTSGVSIIGSSAANSIKGGKGADTISGGAGNDTVSLGAGNDIYIYSSGNDLIQDYTAGQDKIKLSSGSITGASLSSSNLILNVSNGGKITVKGGKDKNITVIDGAGNETTNIYPIDTVPAGISIKTATLTASSSFTGSTIDLANYASTVTKVNATALTQKINILGNAKANSLKGGSGADTIDGGAGNDTIYGGSGADKIYGSAGNDKLYGDAGADTLYAGAGNDTMTGGAGNDVFVYESGKDVITDYVSGDKIKISSGSISSYSFSGDNIIFKIGTGSITVNDGNGKSITIVDANNNTTTQKYSNMASSADLFEDDNFISGTARLEDISEITADKYSVTEIQTTGYETFAQDNKDYVTYSDK